MRRLRIAWHLVLIAALLVSADQGFAGPPTDCPSSNCMYFPLVSVPSPVRVNESTMWWGRGGTRLIEGDVLNTSTTPVYDVVLTVHLYDGSNQLVNTLPVTTLLTATIPNQLSPFGVKASGFVIDHYDVAVSSWHLTSTQTIRLASVVYIDSVLAGDFVYITSTLRNDETVPLLNVHSVTWSLLDEGGPFVQPITPMLAPGQLVTFTTFLYEPYPYHDPSTIKVAAQGVITP